MLQPRRSLVLTRPVRAPDVAIRVDGRVATHEEAMAARVFLGERNSRARPVPHPQARVSITRDAALLEVPAQERDEEGRLGVAWNGPFIAATGMSQSAALDVLVAAIAVA